MTDPFDTLHDELAELSIGTGEYVDRDLFYRERLQTSPSLPSSCRARGTSPCTVVRPDDTARDVHGPSFTDWE